MIRSTKNETVITVTRSVLGSMHETVFGSADGVAPVATVELTEVEYLAANPINTYTIIPSDEHNP